jgi:gas vesicle protein
MEDSNRLSYFFLGLGIGVATGILLAPHSGEETRELLKHKADEGKEFIRRRGTELRDEATDLVERSKQAVARQKDQVTAAVEAAKSAYQESMNNPGQA